ncbi:tetraspanin-15-like isoform X2 [Octopus vulgaris]|uniref:Tetraspanin-15-like isoform X2 n=1 Tax=Octopus vulgaris TaxID=6645 RepID=A0AA36B7V4_OCTVU|nr:tetraspanin-15-like isoform X2 [Octopus vulgaris]
MAPNQDTAQQKMLEAEKHRNPHLMKHPCKPLCANTAYSCNKLWLFLYTLLYVFVGITLLIIGVWAEVERRKYGALNNLMSLPVALLLSVGLIIFINAILGLVGTFQEHVILLKVGDFPRYSCGYNVRRNLTVETNKIIHTDGCTSLLRRLLVLRLDIVGMAGLGSAIPQIIGFLLGYYFIRRVEEYRTWYCVGVIGSSSSANS